MKVGTMVYLAGKISGDPDYKSKFTNARKHLEDSGLVVLDPSLLPASGFTYDAYINISTAMMDECAAVCFLPDWVDSRGAMYEYGRAVAQGKRIEMFEEWMKEPQPNLEPREVAADAKTD